jgi:hypothetical protein
MNNRRKFLRFAAGVAVPAATVAVSGVQIAQADDGDAKDFLGTWTTIHSLPFPPGSFREFLTFSSGGGVNETNSFLNMAGSQDFSPLGLLQKAVKASDGMGNWDRKGRGLISVVFRKMLFDGAGVNFGDLKVTGLVRVDGSKLHADWFIAVVDANGNVLLPFPPATSKGKRIE